MKHRRISKVVNVFADNVLAPLFLLASLGALVTSLHLVYFLLVGQWL
jgi:hypothetical protein